MKHSKWLPLTALLLFVAAPLSQAQDKPGDEWMKGRLFAPELILRHRAELKLTDAQRESLRKELVAVQAKSSEIDFEMLDLATEVQALLEKHPVDTKTVLARVEQMLAIENRKKALFLEMLIKIKNSLTPAQVQIARDLSSK
jgi:Spy/CpxP family protein refolding chaperone